MLNIKSHSMVAVSIAALSFALFGCSGNNSSNPAKAATGAAPKLAAADQAKANAKQAGALIGGNWLCNETNCSVSEELQIAKDLSSFAQTQNITSKEENNCAVTLNSTLSVSSIKDNGTVAVISASIVDGEYSYDGDAQDGTDCYDSVFDMNNDSDNLSATPSKPKAKNLTITLDRSKATLSIAPSDKSGPTQLFTKSN